MPDFEEKKPTEESAEHPFGSTCHKKRHYGPVMWTIFLVLGTFIVTLTYNFANWLLAPRFVLNNEMVSSTNSFDVSATGTTKIVPTKASVEITVDASGKTTEAVKETLDTTLASLKTNLLAIGLKAEEIKTATYNIYPEYNYKSSQLDTIIGYQGSTQVTINSESVDLVNQAIDVAIKDGITQIGGVEFSLDDSEREAGELEATQIAYEKAVAKAEQLTLMAGLYLGDLNSFYSYCDGSQTEGMAYREMAEANILSADTSSTQLEAGSEELTCSVSLNYKLL